MLWDVKKIQNFDKKGQELKLHTPEFEAGLKASHQWSSNTLTNLATKNQFIRQSCIKTNTSML